MKGQYQNKWKEFEKGLWDIWTEPKFAIGQRCILLETPSGNVLWDCIANLDDGTVDFIKGKGGLKAIVISHPHYYTTHLDWAEAFDCPVYFSAEDEEWVSQPDPKGRRSLIKNNDEEIVPDVTAVKLGGHFPGSIVLLWKKKLFIADTLLTVPVSRILAVLLILVPFRQNLLTSAKSALYHIDRLPGTTSYAFMWSIPNFIPLAPPEIYKMWQGLKSLEFESTHGAFVGTDVRDKNVKARVLESMKIQVRNEGWEDHAILNETL